MQDDPEDKPLNKRAPPDGRHDGKRRAATGTVSLDELIVDKPGPTWAGLVKREFMRQHLQEICLADWTHGEMKLLLALDSNGRFSAPRILEDSMGSEKLTACIQRCLRALDGRLVNDEIAGRSFMLTLSPPHANPIVEQ